MTQKAQPNGMTDKSPSLGVGANARAPYKAPRLEHYGDARTLTKAIGTGGKNDNSMDPVNNKTAL